MKSLVKLVLAALGLVGVAGSARAEWGVTYRGEGIERPRLAFWSQPYWAQRQKDHEARWEKLWQDYYKAMESYQRHVQHAQHMQAPRQGYPLHAGMPVVYQPTQPVQPVMMRQGTVQVTPATKAAPAANKGVATATDK